MGTRIGVGVGITLDLSNGVAAAFSPDDISNLSLWLDPDDAATINKTGSTIVTITDKASSVQFGVISAPTIVTAGGVDWMNFAGTDALEVITSGDTAGGVGAGSYTLFTVFSLSGSGTNQTLYNKGAPNLYRSRVNHSVAGNVNSTRTGPTSGLVQNSGGTGANDGLVHIHTNAFDASGLKLRNFLDGTEINSPGSAVSTADNINVTGSNGRINVACAWNGTSRTNFFTGKIGELLLYKKLLSAQEMAQVVTYLSDKWGA